MTEKNDVLLVDDDAQVTGVLRDSLVKAGIRVAVAHSYEEGLAVLTTDPPLCAVVDIMLGGRSGLDLVKEAKLKGVAAQFMVLTNSLHTEDVAEAMTQGITRFVQKADHDPEDIAAMIVRQLESVKKNS